MLFSRLKMLTTVAVMAVSCLSAAHAADPLKAGFVYIGPTGDHGWTYSHDQGRKALEAQSGGKVKTSSVARCRLLRLRHALLNNKGANRPQQLDKGKQHERH